MFIIDTPHHVTLTSYSALPVEACTGNCKKSWFQEELTDQKGSCPMCASMLNSAVEGIHYNVIYHANRELKLSDFKRSYGLAPKEKAMLKEVLGKGGRVECISLIKPNFVKKAEAEWL